MKQSRKPDHIYMGVWNECVKCAHHKVSSIFILKHHATSTLGSCRKVLLAWHNLSHVWTLFLRCLTSVWFAQLPLILHKGKHNGRLFFHCFYVPYLFFLFFSLKHIRVFFFLFNAGLCIQFLADGMHNWTLYSTPERHHKINIWTIFLLIQGRE